MYNFLVVDDVALIRDAICFDIKKEYPMLQIITAANGLEALKKMEQVKVDCLLTDIKMPGCDGLELIRILREERGYQNPIIILSGYSEFEYARKALHYSVMDYLLKPIEADKLTSQIRWALELIKGKREDIILNLEQMRRMNQYLQSQDINALAGFLEKETENIGNNYFRAGSGMIRLIATEISRVYNLSIKEVIEKVDISLDESLAVQEKNVLIRMMMNKIIEFLKEKNLYKEEIGLTEQVKHYIDKNYEKNIKVKELAEQYHVNYTYLSTLFAKETGEGLSAYLTGVRMNSAKQLLRESKLSINDIAKAVGYEDLQYFYRVFKKITGSTPAEYKEYTKKIQ